MNEILGLKIIRWDTEKNGYDEIIKAILILENGKRLTFEVLGTGAFDSELDIAID